MKPRCTLIFGRSHDWTAEQTEAYRILNASHHSLSILTYDHVLERARRMLSMATSILRRKTSMTIPRSEVEPLARHLSPRRGCVGLTLGRARSGLWPAG
jgi:hypothetical protein